MAEVTMTTEDATVLDRLDALGNKSKTASEYADYLELLTAAAPMLLRAAREVSGGQAAISSSDPNVMSGAPCVEGTRVPVAQLPVSIVKLIAGLKERIAELEKALSTITDTVPPATVIDTIRVVPLDYVFKLRAGAQTALDAGKERG